MSEDIYKHIGQRIKDLRKQFGGPEGISQEQLAKMIGVTPNTVSRWETAEYKPKIEDLEKLGKALNVPLFSFLPSEHQPDNTNLKTLLSATADLKEEDIKELTDFALFRKARRVLSEAKKPKKK